MKNDESGEPLHVQQRKQIEAYRVAWKEAGHRREPRVSVSRSIFPLVDDRDYAYFGRRSESEDTIGHIDASTLDRRLPLYGLATELRPICQCINELLDRVEAGFKRERQFNANVAHELRTPIAELRTLAEVAINRAKRNGGDRVHI